MLSRLELRGSPVLTALVVGVHAAAGFALIAVLPAPAGYACALLVGLLGAWTAHQRGLLRAAGSARALELHGDAQAIIEFRDGRRVSGAAGSRRYVGRWLVAVTLATACGRRRSILIAGDMLDAEQFRWLRLWALWGTLPAAGARR